jgi:hypothetical protein
MSKGRPDQCRRADPADPARQIQDRLTFIAAQFAGSYSIARATTRLYDRTRSQRATNATAHTGHSLEQNIRGRMDKFQRAVVMTKG